jgi:DNA sulfur modification protein DndD
LLDLRIRNFRQFCGDQEIVFAHGDAKRNVTVVHGYNGSGKTALLNAFIWCLYGQTTPDLESPERLANERALSEVAPNQPVEVSARLRFRARGETFIAERSVIAHRGADGTPFQTASTKPSLWRIRANGESEPLAAPQDRIDQLLPPRLYPFFFFNGERVERLASPDAYDEVESGVKTLLDVEIYERSERHLRDVRNELTKDLRQHGDTETQAAVDEETRLDTKVAEAREQLKRFRENEAALSKEIETIERRQRETEASRAIRMKRDATEERLRSVEARIGDLRQQAARALSKNGYLAFAEEVFDRTHRLVASARQRGELPAKVKPQFVDDLLKAGECICGRPIEHASPAFARLSEWKQASGLANLEEAISHTSGALEGLRSRRASYFEAIEQCQADTSSAFSEKRRLADELSELKSKLADPSLGDAADLEQMHRELLRRREDLRVETRYTHDGLKQLEEQLGEVRKRIQKLRLDDKKAKLVQHQIEVVDHIADALRAIYEIQKQDVREDLDANVSKIWNDAAVKDYRASVTEDFRLELTKRVGGVMQPVHGASTGEKQVLALSFVGSLVQKARENEESNAAEAGKLGGRDLIVGGEYPLVMDSAFGALEDDYRRKVAEWIPNLAGQVIVMASKTQWRNEVEQAMRARIGKEYVLELHTSKETAARTIEIAGREYPYVVSSDDTVEQTIVQEVG